MEWTGRLAVLGSAGVRTAPLGSTPRCRVWWLVEDVQLTGWLQTALASEAIEEKRRKKEESLTLLDHAADIQQLNGCRGLPRRGIGEDEGG